MKKLVSLMIMLALCLTLLPANVFAEGSAPTISFSAEPTNTAVTITIEADESAPLGEGDEIYFNVSFMNTGWYKYTSPIKLERNGEISAKIVRADGTESDVSTAAISCIDTVAPAAPGIIADTSAWVRDSLTVSITSSSDVQAEGVYTSGIARYEYRIGDSEQWSEYTAPFAVNSATTVFARSVDRAGNVSTEVSKSITNFDTTEPDVSGLSISLSSSEKAVINDSSTFGKYFRKAVSVSFDGARDSESGVRGYQYQLVSNNASLSSDAWQDYSPDNKPNIDGDFCGYVYARAIDAVGNISAAVPSEGFVIDKTAPVITNITPSTKELTDSRVVVKFSASDNVWLENITVNGSYVGIYDPQFTAFRNGDYTIVATDKVGNTTTQVVTISNINATPFTMLNMFNSLSEKDFTPSSWAAAKTAAAELQGQLTLNSSGTMIDAASEKLAAALEALVPRGDGTLVMELVDRVLADDSEKYTESSWARVLECIESIKERIEEPECTQADIDTERHQLEQAITELRVRGTFTTLDRLIEQCEALDPVRFDKTKYDTMQESLTAAKELSRTDSTQEDVDAAYRALLEAMKALKETETEKKGFSFTVLTFVILGLLIIAAAIGLFVVSKRAKEDEELDEDEEDDYYDEYDEEYDYAPDSEDIGDFHITK